MAIKVINLSVKDMTCTSCENRISNSLKELTGVIEARASFKNSSVYVRFDNEKCSYGKICSTIEAAGYNVVGDISSNSNLKSNANKKEILPILAIILIAFVFIRFGQNSIGFDMSSKLGTNTTYIMLFVIGAFTSIHCVGMCGGIMLSQSISIKNTNKYSNLKPALLYNAGRLISYTILGGIVGAIGSVFSITIGTQALISIIAGVFMVIMGFNLAGFKFFRGINIKLPWSSCNTKKLTSGKPLIVGLINGLMPCGPLQTMQLYALATGSAFRGATSMFIFALGTIPLMLVFGVAASFINSSNTKKLLKVSGVVVILLGFIMANRGFTLMGINISPMSFINSRTLSSNVKMSDDNKAKMADGKQLINLTADGKGYTPNVVFLQKNVPAKLIIDGKQITSCNNEIVFPSLNISKKLKAGENIVEFTPSDKDIDYSCWMGMISGKIKVVDNIDSVSKEDVSKAQADQGASSAAGGSCCGPSGGAAQEPTLYGVPISQVPTDKIVVKAKLNGINQSITVNTNSNDFDPLVWVFKNGLEAKVTLDLKNMKDSDGQYDIIESTKNTKVNSFTITNGKGTLDMKFDKEETYFIQRNYTIYGVIKAVNDFDNVDLEKIRSEVIN
ncbi:sulfite exporter TauE/SafE family protein [Clostridium manihotivorum]|uniref:Heavy metal transport/detoxification protein n=1 Tax=Clostridium manihotivorum TaxID=2320868 RepID=A0A3R5QRX8_9CLOT|nr:sulfite exporter TauE/SafE family protein [Clostridium manihotivorum]QAA31056.1 heavy metal transport/detoxification protein [Clostridium manihotivorum]